MKVSRLTEITNVAIAKIENGVTTLPRELKALVDSYRLQCWNNTQRVLNDARRFNTSHEHEIAVMSIRDLPIIYDLDMRELVWAMWTSKSFVKAEIEAILDKCDGFNSKRRNEVIQKWIVEVEDF